MIYSPEKSSFFGRENQIYSSLKLKIIASLPTLLSQNIHANTSLPRVEMKLTFKNVLRETFSFSQLQRPTRVAAVVGWEKEKSPFLSLVSASPQGLDSVRHSSM